MKYLVWVEGVYNFINSSIKVLQWRKVPVSPFASNKLYTSLVHFAVAKLTINTEVFFHQYQHI
jgi:hypothetical protein